MMDTSHWMCSALPCQSMVSIAKDMILLTMKPGNSSNPQVWNRNSSLWWVNVCHYDLKDEQSLRIAWDQVTRVLSDHSDTSFGTRSLMLRLVPWCMVMVLLKSLCEWDFLMQMLFSTLFLMKFTNKMANLVWICNSQWGIRFVICQHQDDANSKIRCDARCDIA